MFDFIKYVVFGKKDHNYKVIIRNRNNSEFWYATAEDVINLCLVPSNPEELKRGYFTIIETEVFKTPCTIEHIYYVNAHGDFKTKPVSYGIPTNQNRLLDLED